MQSQNRLSPRLVRWLIFGSVAAVVTVILLYLPQSFAVVLFAAMVVISLVFWFRLLILPLSGSVGRLLGRLRAGVRAHTTGVSRLLALGACLCVVIGVVCFQPVNGARWPAYVQGVQGGVLLVAVGGVMLSAALRLSPCGVALPRPSSAPLTPERSRWWMAGLGVLILALLAEVNGQALGLGLLTDMSPHVQFVLLGAGIALLIGGLSGLGRPRQWSTPQRQEVWIVAAITAAALAFRFWRLGETVRVLVDELNFILPALAARNGDHFMLLQPFSGMIPFPWLFPYWQGWGMVLVGRGLGGFRAASAVLGALTVPALYGLARALFDRKTALLAALLLVTFPPHYHFSRIGLNNIADPLFGTLALAFLAQALRTHRRLFYALGGASLGLTQYFYEGGRLLFPLLALSWLGLGLLLWRPRLPVRGLILAALAALIVAVPIYYTLVGVQWPLAGRLRVSGLNAEYWQQVFTGEGLQRQYGRLAATLLVYVHQPENSVFYGGDTPLILPLLAPFFLLGLVYALRRAREPGPLLLILWIVGTSLGNSLLVDSAASPRYVIVFPALVLLMTVGLRYTLPLLWPERSPRFQNVVMAVLVAAMTLVQVAYYFGPHLRIYNVQVRPGMDMIDAMLRSADFPPGTHIYLVSDDINFAYAGGMLALLADHFELDELLPPEVTPELLAALPPSVDYAFYVEPTDTHTPALLRERFPHLAPPAFTPYDDVPPERAFILYYVPTSGAVESNARTG